MDKLDNLATFSPAIARRGGGTLYLKEKGFVFTPCNYLLLPGTATNSERLVVQPR